MNSPVGHASGIVSLIRSGVWWRGHRPTAWSFRGGVGSYSSRSPWAMIEATCSRASLVGGGRSHKMVDGGGLDRAAAKRGSQLSESDLASSNDAPPKDSPNASASAASNAT